MTQLKLLSLSVLYAWQVSAHPGHSPLESDAAHQLTHFGYWLPALAIIALCGLIGFVRRKKL